MSYHIYPKSEDIYIVEHDSSKKVIHLSEGKIVFERSDLLTNDESEIFNEYLKQINK